MEYDQPLHAEAALLPAYVNDTLDPEERQQVERHLQSCHPCRQELQEVEAMHTALKTAIHQRPGLLQRRLAK